MKKMTFFILTLSSIAVLAGDLRVNIINGTAKSAGKADQVTLMDLSSGMTPIASESQVNGSITFSDVNSGTQNRYLIQVQYDGVSYTESFTPSTGVEAWETSVTVYERSENTSELVTSIPYYAVYASENELYVQKRLVIENHSNPPVTYMKSPGIVGVHIPENIIRIDQITFKSSDMPLKTQTIDTETGQVLPNAIKPGMSEIDIAYYLPYEGNQATISEKIYYDIDHFHVYTLPTTLHISAPGLVSEGKDSENGWANHAIDQVKAGTTIEFMISGQGITEAQAQSQAQSQQGGGRIVVENRIPMSTELVLSGVLIMLILLALFISITSQSADLKQESIGMLKEQKKSLLKQYSLSSDSSQEQDKILNQLYSVYKTLDRIK